MTSRLLTSHRTGAREYRSGVLCLRLAPLIGVLALLVACDRPETETETLQLNLEAEQTGAARASGDCETRGLTLTGIAYAGEVSGDLTGRSHVAFTSFQPQRCLVGNVVGSWLIEFADGSVLFGVLQGSFTMRLGEEAPPWEARAIRVTTHGGSGRFEDSSGTGACQTSGRLALAEVPPGSLMASCVLNLELHRD